MLKKRIVYVDAIKVFLTCLVVAHHAGQAYGPTGGVWPVSDVNKTSWLGGFFFINASYMMGLYFFISGYFMLFSLNHKTSFQFIRDRLVRLGIPLVFFTLFVFLPFNYSLSQEKSGIIPFLFDSYLHQPPVATGHLWFVASLLLYSFFYLVLFNNHVKPEVQSAVKPFRIYYIPVYIMLLTMISAIVRLKYPIDVWRTWLIPVEVAHIPQYLSLFLLGALFNRYQWLDSFKKSTGLIYLILAILVYFSHNSLPAKITDYWITESFIESMLCVGISMGLLTFFKEYANKQHPFLTILSNNAYGIYLFHVFIVIALQKLILNWNADANIKFILVTIIAILISLGLSVILRRAAIIRKII